MKKTYQCWFWVKKYRHCYLEHMFVLANTKQEACQIVKNQVKESMGRHAFSINFAPPSKNEIEQYRKNSYYVIE